MYGAHSYQSTRLLIDTKREEIAVYGCLRYMMQLAMNTMDTFVEFSKVPF